MYDLSELSQLPDDLPRIERSLQHVFLENFQNFCRVTYCAKIEKGDYFAKVIMSLLSSLPQ